MNFKAINIFTANRVKAHYTESEQPIYRFNAYNEALIPELTWEQASNLMRRWPAYEETDRNKEAHHRIQSVQTLVHFIEPLPEFMDMEQRFSRMIRNGYMTRNPLSEEWIKQLRSGFPDINMGSGILGYQPIIRSNASGFGIIGTSGVGKSTLVESILSLYPQIIDHSEYNGHSLNRTQLVWLKLECPQDGSIKGLCLYFLQAIDQLFNERFYLRHSRRTINELVPIMSQLAANLALGVLVIDEIQQLDEAKSGGASTMLNFFTRLSNSIGLPVVVIGTFKALNFLGSEFANVRRLSGQGDFLWFNMTKDNVWDYFIKRLWRFQWTSIPTPLTPELDKVIYEESLGITDIAVKLYMLAQWGVIGTEDERITPQLIRTVADESLKLSKPLLEALRKKDIKKLQEIRDLYPPIRIDQYLKEAKERVTIIGALDTIGNKETASKYTEVVDEESPVFRVAKWLVEAGVEPAKARECAITCVARFDKDLDLKKVLQAAYSLAFNPDNETIEKPKIINQPRKTSKKVILFPGDIRSVIRDAKNDGKSGYQALKEAGYIRSASEFL